MVPGLLRLAWAGSVWLGLALSGLGLHCLAWNGLDWLRLARACSGWIEQAQGCLRLIY